MPTTTGGSDMLTDEPKKAISYVADYRPVLDEKPEETLRRVNAGVKPGPGTQESPERFVLVPQKLLCDVLGYLRAMRKLVAGNSPHFDDVVRRIEEAVK